MEHIWNNLYVIFKVIWESFGTFAISENMLNFLHCCFFQTYDYFSAKVFISIPCDTRHKSYFF